MSSDASFQRTTIRAIVVIALALIVLGMFLPDIRRAWQPTGNLAFGVDPDNVVNYVDPESDAGRAGLKVGDRIDAAATKPQFRLAAFLQTTYAPGQTIPIVVVRDSQPLTISLVSDPESEDAATKAIIIGRELELLLFVGIGAALVLLRPSIATWAFYLYCLGFYGETSYIVTLSLPTPLDWYGWLLTNLPGRAGEIGIVIFAALFLHEGDTGWRSRLWRIAPAVGIILFGIDAYIIIGQGWFGWSVSAAFAGDAVIYWGLYAVALFAMGSTYVTARGTERQRIRWIVVSFGVALCAEVAAYIINNFFGAWPFWVHASLELAIAVFPLSVGYAVIKYRLLDVSFVVSRALVYTVLTALLVGAFSLVDWFFTGYLNTTRLGTVAEVAVVLAFGFWFNGLHKRVDALVDATFFRQRHRAEIRLARDATALPLASSSGAITHFLVDEPVAAMSLASAAVFRRNGQGLFSRDGSKGWGSADASCLDEVDEPILMLAQAEDGPLTLYDDTWERAGIPDGPARPVVALPIIVRRDLVAIAFYGSHTHGEALDPDEIRALAGLATGAAAAYDHLDAETMRRENDAMRAKNELLERMLAEAQIQPT